MGSEFTPEKLVKDLRAGNRRALSRALSLLEDDTETSRRLVELLYPHTGRAYVVGVTGSPGAGKSTLVDQLVAHYVQERKKVAVIAVDPSSPFTGGALLGDRIRMTNASELDGVFIRSMASRGALGGIAPKTPEAIFAFDAAGFDLVVIETVGVGQGEVEIVRTCDCALVVLVPGMGDGVQALKAGLLEIADLFVINKSDYDGADRLERELLTVLSLEEPEKRKPEILRTVASQPEGIDALLKGIASFRAWAEGSGKAEERKRDFLRQALLRQVSHDLLETFLVANGARMDEYVEQLRRRSTDPATLSRAIIGSSRICGNGEQV